LTPYNLNHFIDCSNLEQDVKRIEANIKRMQKTVTDSVGLLGNASDPDTCRICNVVKFAGGAGYRCHYCQLKSCSRCGGKLTFKTKARQLYNSIELFYTL